MIETFKLTKEQIENKERVDLLQKKATTFYNGLERRSCKRLNDTIKKYYTQEVKEGYVKWGIS